MFALVFIFFSPVKLIGGFYNLNSLNELLFHLIVLLPVMDDEVGRVPSVQICVNALATFLDAKIAFLMIPITVVQTRFFKKDDWYPCSSDKVFPTVLKRIGLTYAGAIALHLLLSDGQELDNILNTLLVRDPSENLGNFWYLMHEMFMDRLPFFRLVFLAMQLAMVIFIAQILYKTFDAIERVATLKKDEIDAAKIERRRQRLVMTGFLLVSFVKMVMCAYPSLHDVNFIFFMLLMNIRLVKQYVEAVNILNFGVAYAIFNSGLLWTTWLKRFSGNANFLFFQIIALNGFLVIMFIYVFMAVDAKRKKYCKEIAIKEPKAVEESAKQGHEKAKAEGPSESKPVSETRSVASEETVADEDTIAM